MSVKRKNRREEDKPSDLTPMIDVTFQLLIFFILVMQFHTPERNHVVELPKDEGGKPGLSVPKDQITIYSQWDPNTRANNYVVGIDSRGRVPVPESYARLNDLVVFSGDRADLVVKKKARYQRVFDNLIETIQTYISRSGANVQKLEIAFARDAQRGASTGTVPWVFVSLAIDAGVELNNKRDELGMTRLPVTFKFSDSLRRYH